MCYDIECPHCRKEFEATEWENGECPNCGKPYWWDEIVTDEDSWSFVLWDDPWASSKGLI